MSDQEEAAAAAAGFTEEQRKAVVKTLTAGVPVCALIEAIVENSGVESRFSIARLLATEVPDFASLFEDYITARTTFADFFNPDRPCPECPLADHLVLLPSEHDTGLFTKATIPRGTNIANYPCDAMMFKDSKYTAHLNNGETLFERFISLPDFPHPKELSACCLTHAVDVTHPFVSAIAGCNVGSKSPFLAHMANDGIGFSLLEGMNDPQEASTSQWFLRYYKELVSKCNARIQRHNNGDVSIVAAKDIVVSNDPLTGKPVPVEILIAYGPGYFLKEKWPGKFKNMEEADATFYKAPNLAAKKIFDRLLPPNLLDFVQPNSVPCSCTFCEKK
jgi:hypothetical protein